MKMHERNTVVKWVIQEHYDNDVLKASRATGFTEQQLRSWLTGDRTPQSSNVSRLMHHAFEPAFSWITEFAPIEHTGQLTSVHGQLSAILKGFHKCSGVYAFYDSSGNLLYLGKTDGNLLAEMYTQLKAGVAKSAVPPGIPPPRAFSDHIAS